MDWNFIIKELMFCFINCSHLLWEKIVLVTKKRPNFQIILDQFNIMYLLQPQSFSSSLQQFFLIVCQKNFQNKVYYWYINSTHCVPIGYKQYPATTLCWHTNQIWDVYYSGEKHFLKPHFYIFLFLQGIYKTFMP